MKKKTTAKKNVVKATYYLLATCIPTQLAMLLLVTVTLSDVARKNFCISFCETFSYLLAWRCLCAIYGICRQVNDEHKYARTCTLEFHSPTKWMHSIGILMWEWKLRFFPSTILFNRHAFCWYFIVPISMPSSFSKRQIKCTWSGTNQILAQNNNSPKPI